MQWKKEDRPFFLPLYFVMQSSFVMMKNAQASLPVLANPPSLLRATASSAAYALVSGGGGWLLWHYRDSWAAGLSEGGAQSRADTAAVIMLLDILLASGLFWWKSFLGYWYVHNQVGNNGIDAQHGVVIGWRLLLSLLLMGWLVVDFITIIYFLASMSDWDSRTN